MFYLLIFRVRLPPRLYSGNKKAGKPRDQRVAGCSFFIVTFFELFGGNRAAFPLAFGTHRGLDSGGQVVRHRGHDLEPNRLNGATPAIDSRVRFPSPPYGSENEVLMAKGAKSAADAK
jgi:hypothetical protein